MSTINKAILIGHLGDDVKMHYFEGGNSIGRFSIATNESYVNKNTGEQVKNTDWHNIIVRNKAAEVCDKYLKKGDKVYIEGKIKSRKYQGQDGLEKFTTEIHADSFKFLTPKVQDSAPASGRENSAVEQYNQQQAEKQNGVKPDDDLPF